METSSPLFPRDPNFPSLIHVVPSHGLSVSCTENFSLLHFIRIGEGIRLFALKAMNKLISGKVRKGSVIIS